MPMKSNLRSDHFSEVFDGEQTIQLLLTDCLNPLSNAAPTPTCTPNYLNKSNSTEALAAKQDRNDLFLHKARE